MLTFSVMSRPRNLRDYRWRMNPAAPVALKEEVVNVHPVLLQVLYNRHIREPAAIRAFLDGQYLKSRDPFLLKDMDKAVERIERAIDGDEMVVVYGDFDADGVTSTVLLVETLRGLGMSRQQAQPYIPDRVDEGYGLNKKALTSLRERGASLVISVDCGIRSIREIEHANDIGLDTIITDHHSLGPKMPPSLAVINPHQPESEYPESRLAGVGIAFKLAQALNQAFSGRSGYDEENLLDLVALGTIADLAPLRGENRDLVAEGLRVLNSCRRPGIEALAQVSGFKAGSITAESISFGLGPRINAAGRLAHAYDAARLLAANDALQAREYARELNDLNRKRQQVTAQLTKLAEEAINPDDALLFVADERFMSGVVGLVASRLVDKFYRPAIIIEEGEIESRGSCRSIPEFHITDALDEVMDLLVRHGGHAQAAGFTIRNENLPEFRQRITGLAAEKLDAAELAPVMEIDAELKLASIREELHQELLKLEPTGIENEQPVFKSSNVRVLSHRAVGQDGFHLQLLVGDGHAKHRCIAFQQGAWAGHLPEQIDLAYTIGINEWNGRRDLQLTVKDIREANS